MARARPAGRRAAREDQAQGQADPEQIEELKASRRSSSRSSRARRRGEQARRAARSRAGPARPGRARRLHGRRRGRAAARRRAATLSSSRATTSSSASTRSAAPRCPARVSSTASSAGRLELALYRFVLDRLTAKGFATVLPPVLVREDAMYGTGFLPTDEVNLYRVERDELYLTGTSEVALAAMHAEEVLDADALPLQHAAIDLLPPRGGAAGRTPAGCSASISSTRSRCSSSRTPSAPARPTTSCSRPRRTGRRAGLPTASSTSPAISALGLEEVRHRGVVPWPGPHREITSTSNTTDYQSRRLEIRFRGEHGLSSSTR